MKKLLELIASDLRVALAILILLGGAFLLPYSQAAQNASVGLSLEVIDPNRPPSSKLPPPVTPPPATTDTPPIQPTPPVEDPEPEAEPPKKPDKSTENFQLEDYAPRLLDKNRTNRLFIFGRNFPAKFQIVIETESGTYVGDHELSKRNLDILSRQDRIVHILPFQSLPLGEGKMYMRVENQKLTKDLPVFIYERSPAMNFRLKPVNYPKKLEMGSGDVTKIKVTFQNQTNVTMTNYFRPILIGTSKPFDRTSKFIHDDWPFADRPAKLLDDKHIGPGDTITLEMTLQAPQVNRRTRFVENFALVNEGLAWLASSEFKLDIMVNPVKTQSTIQPRTLNTQSVTRVFQSFTVNRQAPQVKKEVVEQPKPKSPYKTQRRFMEQPGFLASLLRLFGR